MQNSNISSTTNLELINIKGVNSCYHCKENNIKYDDLRD